VSLGELRLVKGVKKADLAGTITLAPPSATSDIWTRRFPDPVTAFASGWMRVRARAPPARRRIAAGDLGPRRLGGLTGTIDATGAGEVWVTHGQEDALVHWCGTKGSKRGRSIWWGTAKRMKATQRSRRGDRGMNRFAQLLDRLAYEPGRQQQAAADRPLFPRGGRPDRGYALAALTGALSFKHAKPGLIRDLIAERTDPVLFALSYDYVGDLSETVALMWPKPSPLPPRAMRVEGGGLTHHNNPPQPTLTEVVTTLRTLGKTELPSQLTRWLDEWTETGRWALLKLVTGAMRIASRRGSPRPPRPSSATKTRTTSN